MRTLSSDHPKGKVLKGVSMCEEKIILPENRMSIFPEGGKQIDPYLLASAEIQELHRRIEALLEREKDLKEELSDIKKNWEKQQSLLDEEKKALEKRTLEENLEIRKSEAAKGYEEGYKSGLENGRDELEQKIKTEYKNRFQQQENLGKKILEEMQITIEKDITSVSPKMVRIWQIMLERLLRREVLQDEETVLRIFREIIHRVSDWSRIRLFLNPVDRELFLSRSNEIAEIKRVADIFEIISDENIEKGSCLLETNLGVYDARWKSQFEAIDREIDNLIREACADGSSRN